MKTNFFRFIAVAAAFSIAAVAVFTACGDKEEDDPFAPLYGYWSFNIGGTVIHIEEPYHEGRFHSFGSGDWWEATVAQGLIDRDDPMLMEIKSLGDNKFSCIGVGYTIRNGTVIDLSMDRNATITVADDGKSFYLSYPTLGEYATLYRTDSGGGNEGGGNSGTGSIFFWIAKDFGCGNITGTLAGKGSGTLRTYFTSGTSDCGDNGTVTFGSLPYGTYSFTARCESYSWESTIRVDRSCMPMQLQ